jgi:hypothetical protein
MLLLQGYHGLQESLKGSLNITNRTPAFCLLAVITHCLRPTYGGKGYLAYYIPSFRAVRAGSEAGGGAKPAEEC